MAIKRQVRKVGNSLSIVIPRDMAAAMDVKNGSDVYVTYENGRLSVEPVRKPATKAQFRRAFAKVLRDYDSTFAGLAAYDEGR